MTATRPVTAPPVEAVEPRSIRQSRIALVGSWIGTALWVLWPMALLQRVFGLYASPWNQLWIIPVGILAALYMARRVPRAGRSRATLTVDPAALVYDDGGGRVHTVERVAVGLVDVSSSRGSRQWCITVFDHESRLLASWTPGWLGHDATRVVTILRAAGYPAGRHDQIYDGGFQHQMSGQTPQAVSLD